MIALCLSREGTGVLFVESRVRCLLHSTAPGRRDSKVCTVIEDCPVNPTSQRTDESYAPTVQRRRDVMARRAHVIPNNPARVFLEDSKRALESSC